MVKDTLFQLLRVLCVRKIIRSLNITSRVFCFFKDQNDTSSCSELKKSSSAPFCEGVLICCPLCCFNSFSLQTDAQVLPKSSACHHRAQQLRVYVAVVFLSNKQKSPLWFIITTFVQSFSSCPDLSPLACQLRPVVSLS